MTFAIDFAPPQPGFLSADRLRRWAPWTRVSPAVRDIQSSATRREGDTAAADPVLEARLQEIANLVLGWNEGSALPVDPRLIEVVRNFISNDFVTRIAVRPDLVPTFGGGILIEWHTGPIDLIIEIDPSESPSFYYSDNESGQEIEALVGEHVESMTAAFFKLTQLR